MKKKQRRKRMRTYASEQAAMSPDLRTQLLDLALAMRAMARMIENMLRYGRLQAPQPPDPSARTSDCRRSKAERKRVPDG